MRFLLDTNILIPLEDSNRPLAPALATFVSLAHKYKHDVVYHPASERDLLRDKDPSRRQRVIERLSKYQRLEITISCPANGPATSANDACDNEILYALECDAAHFLVTEDKGIHAKAKRAGLVDRVLAIKEAEDLLKRLHETLQVVLPNIDDVHLHNLTPLLQTTIFNSLRADYLPFDVWFRKKAAEGRKAWVYWKEPSAELGAICIYDKQNNPEITDNQKRLDGDALKLCTFKVDDDFRGRKIGELFLKMAFRYATENRLTNIFIHAKQDKQEFLIEFLKDFGFYEAGQYKTDLVLVKEHPIKPPPENLPSTPTSLEYCRKYFPHYSESTLVKKFLVPIRPSFHEILFPDFEKPGQISLLSAAAMGNSAGNAIKMAYLCHSKLRAISPGDIVLFYRSEDLQSVTSIGVVEAHQMTNDAERIIRLVKRRTVYSFDQIEEMANKQTKVLLFRLIGHVPSPVTYQWMKESGTVAGFIQSIRQITDGQYAEIIKQARR